MTSPDDRQLLLDSLQRLRDRMSDVSGDFYRHLLQTDPSLVEVFDLGATARQTKFVNMLSTLARAKDLDKIGAAIHALGGRHTQYGVHGFHFDSVKHSLSYTLGKHLGSHYDAPTRQAWNGCFARIAELMLEGARHRIAVSPTQSRPADSYEDRTLLADIGGETVVTRVHTRFYDWIFEDPWLGRFFGGKSKESLIKKQTEFMLGCFGGENRYRGDTPAIAHMHMLVTDEMYDLRQFHLRRCILEEGLAPEIAERWIGVDGAFRRAIVRQSADQCVMRCFGQFPLVVEKPLGYPWPL